MIILREDGGKMFNSDFIEKHNYTPERYKEKYISEIKVLRK